MTDTIRDMKTKLALLSVLSIFLTACGGSQSADPVPAESNEVVVVAQNPADPANAPYYIDGIVYTLVDGSLEQPIDKSEVLNKFKLLDFRGTGDINSDGTDDIAVVLIDDAWESGTFYYLGILTSGATPIIENTSFLGDRIEIKGIEFVDGKFEVTYLDRDVETSFDEPPSIEIVGIAELDEEKTTFNFTCRDSVGICL